MKIFDLYSKYTELEEENKKLKQELLNSSIKIIELESKLFEGSFINQKNDEENFLKFLGIGSCFNYMMGNTSAYYKKDSQMILIDCGETVFGKLCKTGLLNDIKDITIVITHLHSDHIGSLPSLIFYLYFVKKDVKINIVFPNKEELKQRVLFSVGDEMYTIFTPQEYNENSSLLKIRAIRQKHCKGIKSYGYEMMIDKKMIYYSGDTNEMPGEILNNFLNHKYTAFYHEVTKYKNDVHFYILNLLKLIPEDRRNEVYCIHLDDKELETTVEKFGFKVPNY